MRELVPNATARTLVAKELGKKSNKHHAEPTTVDGVRHASKREARRYATLRRKERAGEICNLEPHPRFDLTVDGQHIGYYTADAQYRDVKTGTLVIEDTKGASTRTEAYMLRKKLMKAIHGIDIVEITEA
jgi:hypothetical protein